MEDLRRIYEFRKPSICCVWWNTN